MKIVLFILGWGIIGVVGIIDEEWEHYRIKYSKSYRNLTEEYIRRFIYEKIKNMIDATNREYKLRIRSYNATTNKYADYPDEYTSRLFGIRVPNRQEMENFLKHVNPYDNRLETYDPPPYINWSDTGIDDEPAFTAWDQGDIGSDSGCTTAVYPLTFADFCAASYAFATLGVFEAHYNLKYREYIKLSEQQLIDCSGSSGNFGCEGGTITSAYDYFINKQYGALKEEDYKYSGHQQICQYNSNKTAARLDDYRALPLGNEKLMLNTLAYVGPLVAVMDASQPSFLFYNYGIYDDPACQSTITAMNHAVIIFGYGSENGKDYWLIKNSWSDDWGMKGYGRILRNGLNFCGLANMVSYPVVH